MLKKLTIVVAFVFFFITTFTPSGMKATDVENFGFAVLGKECGRPNAIGIGTPIVKRNSEMACIRDSSDVLKWTSLPRNGAHCGVSDQVWGAVRCVSGKWSSTSLTFSGTFDDAFNALKTAVAWTHENDVSSIGAPSRTGYATEMFNHSVIERELTERLATNGYEVDVFEDKVFVLAKNGEERCARFVDPWPQSQSTGRTLRIDAVTISDCPTGSGVSVSSFRSAKSILLRVTNTWRASLNLNVSRDETFYLNARQSLVSALDVEVESAEWQVLYGIGFPIPYVQSVDIVQFRISGGCYKYTFSNGVGVLFESFCP